MLVTHGLTLDEDAPWHLILDAPLGYASIKLSSLDPARTIIISDNPCADYQVNLLERKPAALLPWLTTEKLIETLREVWSGKNIVATFDPLLAPRERLTLQLIAEGYEINAIAEKMDVTEGTLRNRIHDIYTKLGLNSGVQLSHYYYGRWRLLVHHHNWRPRLSSNLTHNVCHVTPVT